jgi:hypothetical protein
MTKFMLAAFALALGGAASSANADFTTGPGWGCYNCGYKNGTQLTGIALNAAAGGIIGTVILPSGEAVDLL